MSEEFEYDDDYFESINCDKCGKWMGVIADASMYSSFCVNCYEPTEACKEIAKLLEEAIYNND